VIDSCVAPKMKGAAVEIAGQESSGIRLMGDDFTRSGHGVDVRDGAVRGAVTM